VPADLLVPGSSILFLTITLTCADVRL